LHVTDDGPRSVGLGLFAELPLHSRQCREDTAKASYECVHASCNL
jgi:hypothetical protein